jgi:hypothetical protein
MQSLTLHIKSPTTLLSQRSPQPRPRLASTLYCPQDRAGLYCPQDRAGTEVQKHRTLQKPPNGTEVQKHRTLKSPPNGQPKSTRPPHAPRPGPSGSTSATPTLHRYLSRIVLSSMRVQCRPFRSPGPVRSLRESDAAACEEAHVLLATSQAGGRSGTRRTTSPLRVAARRMHGTRALQRRCTNTEVLGSSRNRGVHRARRASFARDRHLRVQVQQAPRRQVAPASACGVELDLVRDVLDHRRARICYSPVTSIFCIFSGHRGADAPPAAGGQLGARAALPRHEEYCGGDARGGAGQGSVMCVCMGQYNLIDGPRLVITH